MKTIIKFAPCRKIKACCAAVAWCAVVAFLLPACATRSQYQKGYDAGASDTVKRQYWILQDMEKCDGATEPRQRLSVYRMTVTPDPNAKVKTVPYEIAIPVYE